MIWCASSSSATDWVSLPGRFQAMSLFLVDLDMAEERQFAKDVPAPCATYLQTRTLALCAVKASTSRVKLMKHFTDMSKMQFDKSMVSCRKKFADSDPLYMLYVLSPATC